MMTTIVMSMMSRPTLLRRAKPKRTPWWRIFVLPSKSWSEVHFIVVVVVGVLPSKSWSEVLFASLLATYLPSLYHIPDMDSNVSAINSRYVINFGALLLALNDILIQSGWS